MQQDHKFAVCILAKIICVHKRTKTELNVDTSSKTILCNVVSLSKSIMYIAHAEGMHTYIISVYLYIKYAHTLESM